MVVNFEIRPDKDYENQLGPQRKENCKIRSTGYRRKSFNLLKRIMFLRYVI